MITTRSFFPGIVVAGMIFVHPAWASIAYTGSTIGTNGSADKLSAQVTFLLAGQTDSYGHTCSSVVGTLCMSLVNSQAGGTEAEADVLGAVYFSVTGSPTLTSSSALADTVLDPNSTGTAVLSSVRSGGWALVTSPGTDSNNPGLPTTGYVWATVGNGGAVSTGTVGTDNYSIISGTNAVASGGITVISNELFLTLTGFKSGSTSLTLSAINNVVFTWDVTGQFSANGILTPEPGTAGFTAMALMGIFVGGKALRRRGSGR